MKTLFERMSDIARANAAGSIAQKAAHVRAEARKGAGNHTCHWPGCDQRVPPSMWGCKPHWYRLPSAVRNRIWTAYKLGQEISKTPTPEYVAASREAQEWAAQDDRRVQMINRGWTYDL